MAGQRLPCLKNLIVEKVVNASGKQTVNAGAGLCLIRIRSPLWCTCRPSSGSADMVGVRMRRPPPGRQSRQQPGHDPLLLAQRLYMVTNLLDAPLRVVNDVPATSYPLPNTVFDGLPIPGGNHASGRE